MKKLLPALFLALTAFTLVSCKKEAPENQPVTTFYPTEITRTSSNSPEIYKTKYGYNASNQIIKEEFYLDNVPQRYNAFTYYPDGKLHKKRVFTSTNRFFEQDEIFYDAGSGQVKLQHSYIDSSGTPNLHHINTFIFDAAGRIIHSEEHAPDQSLTQSRSFVFKSGNMVESVGSNGRGQFIDKIESVYDDKRSPFAHTGIHLVTFAGNELRMELKDQNNRPLSQYTYTNSYEYHKNGYPLKRIQTQASGTIVTETYLYKTE